MGHPDYLTLLDRLLASHPKGADAMKLVQIFLPLYPNTGRRFPAALFARERERLVERFGGLTAFMQAPAQGLWKNGPKLKRDEIVIFEVMIRRVDRRWRSHYRHGLRKRFKQKELLIRVSDVKVV
jgi:hypothetical protein